MTSAVFPRFQKGLPPCHPFPPANPSGLTDIIAFACSASRRPELIPLAISPLGNLSRPITLPLTTSLHCMEHSIDNKAIFPANVPRDFQFAEKDYKPCWNMLTASKVLVCNCKTILTLCMLRLWTELRYQSCFNKLNTVLSMQPRGVMGFRWTEYQLDAQCSLPGINTRIVQSRFQPYFGENSTFHLIEFVRKWRLAKTDSR